MASRTSAQQRADEIRVFQQELARLEQEGTLELADAQREKVTRHHAALLAQYAASFDIDRDLYGRMLRVAFVQRLRDERMFESLDALRTQIAADCVRARVLFGRLSL